MTALANPFRTSNLEEIKYRFTRGDLDTLILRAKASNYRGCIVGRKGTGKTTLLEEIERTLVEMGLHPALLRLNLSSNWREKISCAFRSYPEHSILLIDGAEQLPQPLWRILALNSRRYNGLIVTAHSPLSLPVLHECLPNFTLAAELANRLSGNSTVPPTEELERIYYKLNCNMREFFLALYDLHRVQSKAAS